MGQKRKQRKIFQIFMGRECKNFKNKFECFRPKSLEFIEPKRQIFKKSQKANNQNRVLEPKEQIKQKILKLGQESLIPKGIKKKYYSKRILWNLIPLGIKKSYSQGNKKYHIPKGITKKPYSPENKVVLFPKLFLKMAKNRSKMG